MAVADTELHANFEAEQSVLGAVLINDTVLYGLVVGESLKPDDFYWEGHRAVYEAMLSLYEEAAPADPVSVTERLRQSGRLEAAGGAPAVHALAAAVPVAGNARHYARIVRDNALQRRLRQRALQILEELAERSADTAGLIDRAERMILEVRQGDAQKDFQSVGDVLHVELDRLHELSTKGAALTGTPSGFKDLDAITGGFQPGNLIIVAARPGMGKSALVANIAENAAITHGKPVALFSLEMSETELAQRFVASQASIKGEDLRHGRVDEKRWPRILQACQKLAAAPLYIDDSSDVGITEVRAKARRLYQQSDDGLGLIIVDYLQLMRADQRIENRVQQVGELSRGLKLLARELKVPVIALSQLSRAVEQRAEKVPQLSDLRESGNLEQDADLVMFIYRDDYYDDESERQGEADLIIAKHRNGALGKVSLAFRGEFPKFLNLAREDRFAA